MHIACYLSIVDKRIYNLLLICIHAHHTCGGVGKACCFDAMCDSAVSDLPMGTEISILLDS